MFFWIAVALAAITPVSLDRYVAHVMPGQVRTAGTVLAAFFWLALEAVTVVFLVTDGSLVVWVIHIILMAGTVWHSWRRAYLHYQFAVTWPTEEQRKYPLSLTYLHYLTEILREAYPTVNVNLMQVADARYTLWMNGREIITLNSTDKPGG